MKFKLMYPSIKAVLPVVAMFTLLVGCGKSDEAAKTPPKAPSSPVAASSPKPTPTANATALKPPGSPSATTPGLKKDDAANQGMKSQESKCAANEPVKGNIGKNGNIYHLPGTPGYDVVKAETCFKDAASAEKAGYRAPKTHEAPKQPN